jgi:hypothetical protein
MNYLAEFREQANVLFESKGIEAVIKYSTDKIFESYKNGIAKNGKLEPKKPLFSKSTK